MRRENGANSDGIARFTEAQAALLALGGSLEWTRYEYGNYAEEEARTEAGDYLVKTIQQSFFRTRTLSMAIYYGEKRAYQTVSGLPSHRDLTQAKLACEWHHATRRWKT